MNDVQQTSAQFGEKIKTIKERFFSALEDYRKYYVYRNKNPEVTEFQNYYENSKNQLQQMGKDIVELTNNIDKQINTIDENFVNVSAELETEKAKHEKLTKQLKTLENTHNGSEILIDDSKVAYNTQNTENWELFIGVILITGLVVSLFKPKPTA